MLGEDFELEFSDGTALDRRRLGRGALGALLHLGAARDRAARTSSSPNGPRPSTEAFVELYEPYREDERVHAPRRYLLTLGTRR